MLMPALKGDIIKQAYYELRISGMTVDPTPEDTEVGLRKLENMAADFASRNMSVGYIFEDQPDPNSAFGVAREFWDAFALNLAVRLIPGFNKQVPVQLEMQAASALSGMAARCAALKIRPVLPPNRQPVGSGNERYGQWNRYYNNIGALPPNAPGVQAIMQGETNDFAESFEAYLRTDEVIDTYEVVADIGLTVVSMSNNDPVISYRLTAPVNQTSNIFQQVKVTITTDLGRVDIRVIDFQVAPRIRVGPNVN